MVDIGFKNFIDEKRVINILTPDTTRAKFFIREAVEGNSLIDGTQGRKTNSIIILKTGHIVLSNISFTAIKKKFSFAGKLS